jgi:hypothetical protein
MNRAIKVENIRRRIYAAAMGRIPKFSVRISCRLTKVAGQKLGEQLAKLVPDKLGRPQIGKLLSQLILDAKPEDWARAKGKTKLLEKPQWIEADRKLRTVEKEKTRKRRSPEKELEMENMGWEERVWRDDEE